MLELIGDIKLSDLSSTESRNIEIVDNERFASSVESGDKELELVIKESDGSFVLEIDKPITDLSTSDVVHVVLDKVNGNFTLTAIERESIVNEVADEVKGDYDHIEGEIYERFDNLETNVESNIRTHFEEVEKDIRENAKARAYSKLIGDGRKSYTVTHSLNTTSLIVQLWCVRPYDLPFYEIARIDENTIQIDFEEPIATDSVEVVIQSNYESKQEVVVTKVEWDDILNIPFMSLDEMNAF